MPESFDLEIIDNAAGLRALHPEWRELHEESQPRNPCLSPEWCLACWEHTAKNSSPFVVTARRAGRLVGLAPFALQRRRGQRVLRALGQTWSTYPGFLLSPSEPGTELGLLDGLLAARSRWDILLLQDLTESYTPLLEAELPSGLLRASAAAEISRRLNLEPGWETLLREGPQQLRHSRRPARRWEREGGTIERLSGAEAAACVEEIAAVESASWKAEEGVLQFQRPGAHPLWRQLLTELGEQGEAELWLARLDGKLTAFQINLVAGDRLWFYYGAYDPAFRPYYPGGVLHYHIIEDACRRGFREYDFLTGSEPYKYGWTDGERQLHRAALYPRTARGYLAMALLVGPRWRMRESPTGRKIYELYRILRWRRQALVPFILGHRARAH